MSVLVKGMKMPDSCHECVAGFGGYCFVATAESDGICADHGRPDDCPLVELPPHGRLIDGDIAEVIAFDEFDVPENGDFGDGILYAADWIASQPTIVEAEE